MKLTQNELETLEAKIVDSAYHLIQSMRREYHNMPKQSDAPMTVNAAGILVSLFETLGYPLDPIKVNKD